MTVAFSVCHALALAMLQRLRGLLGPQLRFRNGSVYCAASLSLPERDRLTLAWPRLAGAAHDLAAAPLHTPVWVLQVWTTRKEQRAIPSTNPRRRFLFLVLLQMLSRRLTSRVHRFLFLDHRLKPRLQPPKLRLILAITQAHRFRSCSDYALEMVVMRGGRPCNF